MRVVQSLTASRYTDIQDRGKDLEDVSRELNNLIDALPTQVHPTERELYLDALLDDLEDREGAPWTLWPDDIYLLALRATKTLGRNPIGSDTLHTTRHLHTILHHTALPLPSPASPFSHPSSEPSAPPALEALRVLANTLLLFPAARDKLTALNGAKAVARALTGRDWEGNDVSDQGEGVDRLFLLARIGFMVALQREEAVALMVDEEGVLESVSYHLSSTPLIPDNYDAITEILKFAYNLVRFYPFGEQSPNRESNEQWEERFDVFLYPTLCIFHLLPVVDLIPPITYAINLLWTVPFPPRLLPTWNCIPEYQQAESSSTSMRSFLAKLSSKTSVLPTGSAKSSADSTPGRNISARASSPPSTASSKVGSSKRSVTVVPSHLDPTLLPSRLLLILDRFCDAYIPYPRKPDDELQMGLVLEESLPPLLLLLGKAANGSEPVRAYLKQKLLPTNLDRSPESGPLEARRGTLGNLLRFMVSTTHPTCQAAVDELMWAVCNEDAQTLSIELGYGNVAGLLFRRGISGPLPARLEEIPDKPLPSSTTTLVSAEARHPITSLRNVTQQNEALDDMTDEEKEREAERLFVLFERMEKNNLISAKSGDGGKEKSVKEVLREKMAGLDSDGHWAEEERRKEAEKERKEEEAMMREMEAYKRRTRI